LPWSTTTARSLSGVTTVPASPAASPPPPSACRWPMAWS
jgi:hypothetical protein